MSATTRAKKLMNLTGWGFQQCLNHLNKLGPQASAHAQKNNWPRERSELYLTDKYFDDEYKAAWKKGARYVGESNCENCYTLFFVPRDKKGIVLIKSERFCADCIDQYGLSECPRCGRDQLDDDVCSACMKALMSDEMPDDD